MAQIIVLFGRIINSKNMSIGSPQDGSDALPEGIALSQLSTTSELAFRIRFEDGREFNAGQITVGNCLLLYPKIGEQLPQAGLGMFTTEFKRKELDALIKTGSTTYLMVLNDGTTIPFSVIAGETREVILSATESTEFNSIGLWTPPSR